MAKPLLSIGMIVKNEIRCIEKCLQALQPLRDAISCELVIADTGSDDGTREVAERYADILFDFTWVNDFSAARNAVMDRCSGLWHFTIDADEYLDPDIDELVRFLKAPAKKNVDFASVIARNYLTTDMRSTEYTDFTSLRLARMNGVRYTGAIHEHWTMQIGQMSEILQHTIIHHDGYANNLGERAEEKQKRNMTLLREELRQNPDDLRVILQAIESSHHFKAEQMEYIRHGMKLIMADPQKQNAAVAAAICRFANRVAMENGIPETEEWLQWGEKHFAQSIFFRIDTNILAAVFFYNLKNYERSLYYGEQYLTGYVDYQNGNYDIGETTVSTVSFCMPEHYTQACQIVAKSYLELENAKKAVEILQKDDQLLQTDKHVKNSLVLLQELHEKPETAEDAERLCAKHMNDALAAGPEDEEKWKHRTVCLGLAAIMFGDEESHGWRVFRSVSGDLGIAARAMDETEPEKLNILLGQIQRWKEVPNPVILHAVLYGASLPDGFYQKGVDSLRNTAAAIGARPGIQEKLAAWMEQDDFYASMVKFQFLFELTAAAVQAYDWSDTATGIQLINQFCTLAGDYLPNYYNVALLEDEEDRKTLPALHQFAFSLLKAREVPDEIGYVRELRKALENAPILKKTVDFLLKQRVLLQSDPKLISLAQHVKRILEQFMLDDPAVRQLLEQPEYQKILPLLGENYVKLYGGINE